MKRIIQAVWNIFVSIWSSITLIVFTCWYGKLPKVSLYHIYEPEHIKDIFVPYWQSRNFKENKVDEGSVWAFTQYLKQDKRLTNLSFKLFDEEGQLYGEASFGSYINDKVNQFLKENNK